MYGGVHHMNLIITLFLAASIQAADIPHEDTDFGCTNVNKAEQYRRDFNIDTRSFGGNELCKSQVDTKKLYNDLQIVEEGTFSQSGDNLFIKGFVPQNQYYAWLKSQTRGVERGNDIPAATAYNSGGYFTMQDGWAKLSTLGRVGTIVHEARHTAGYRHFACSYGPYADSRMPGCDTHYGQAGSHGVEMEYYGRVSVRGQNFHPIYKSMARLMAVARSNFVFNTPPMKKREGLLVLTQDQKAYLIADGERVERERPSVQGQLKRTSFGASILSDARHL